jgi:cobalt-zinc-cadmium efflux system protein
MPSERPEPHSHTRDAGTYLEHGADDGSHGHSRARRPSRAIRWALALVLGFAGVEALVGWLSGSLALLADSVHMLTDGIALGLAFAAQLIARRRPSATHSFGYERAEPMAAFVNGLFYLALLGAIAVEAVQRLLAPTPIIAGLALPVAVLGLLINAVMLWLLHEDRDQINARAALLHVIGDFAGSLIAIVAITVAWTTGWTRIDPLLSLALCVLMLVSTWRVLRDSGRILMNAAPESIDVEAVAGSLQSVDGVRSVHDLHVWALGASATALAAHLRIDRIESWPQVLARAREALRTGFGIEHVTLQPEVLSDAGAQVAEARDADAERLRAERDAAIAHSIEVEQERDLSREMALRFEREFDGQRQVLARELHDELAQHATAIRTMASTFESRLSEREPSLAQLARLMVRNTDALFATVRTMTARLRPEPLEHGGLLEGLRTLVADWKLRKPGMRFELLLEPADDERFGLATQAIEGAAWRIAADAIENAVAHAGARTVIVSARRDSGALTLQVSDDGRGLPGEDAREGAGLRSMRVRAQACGGSLTVATGEAGGVEVLVRLPWPAAPAGGHAR